MMRWIGAALLLGGMGVLGFSAAELLRRRVEALSAFADALERIERELAFRLTSVPELLEMLARESREPAGKFFARCSRELEHLGEKTLAQIWKEELAPLDDTLGSEGMTVLQSVGSVIGRYDGEGQREALGRAREQLEDCLLQARKERAGRGKVYGALSVGTGALLAILLL